MIGAIRLKLNEKCRAKLYLMGTYNRIDWDTEYSTELGDEISAYGFVDTPGKSPFISIAQGLDDKYVLRLVETKKYVIRMENDDGAELYLPRFQNESNKFLKCDKDKDSVVFKFVNYLGRSKIHFREHDALLSFEVVPNKMNYEDDYIALTENIADECSELLLDYAGTTSNVYGHSNVNKRTLLEQFIFLRKFCYSENIQGLFEAIKRNPDRSLDQEEELKPFGIGMPSKKFFQNPFSHGKNWTKLIDSNTGRDIFLPQMVSVTHKFDKLDTPANRFVKFALQKFDSICVDLVQALKNDGQDTQAECVEEAKAIHKIIENIFRDSFFDEIGTMDVMPQNNQVLQKREGYSQIFSAYAMLNLALQLDWKGKDEVYEGESKNVALLYEYWLFFELYRIIKSIEGCTATEKKKDPFISFEDGIKVSLEEGKKSCQSFEIKKYGVKINLYYNRTFSKIEFKATKYERSYSRPFRPDYTLAIFPFSFRNEKDAIVDGAVSYVHFDAKYRITDLTYLTGNIKESEKEEVESEKIESVDNTYKRGDLLKMHTYNDAIRRTIGSYVLYPGNTNVESSFRLYDEILSGVGAFSIKPSIREQGETELRSFIISLIECKKSENSRLNRLGYYTETVLREPSIQKNQSVESDIKPMKKGDMYVMGYIRSDSKDDYYYFLKENGFFGVGTEFIFYFYAIKGKNVYSHHKDVFKAKHFRFYVNKIHETNTYVLEPTVCKIISDKLVSKAELVNDLCNMGFETNEKDHHADFYYVLKLKVESEDYQREEIKIGEANNQNGNDTFSPHSPKVMSY